MGDLFNPAKPKTTEREGFNPTVERMRDHGSQHWRKPHGIRYGDYGRNNSLIRATLPGGSRYTHLARSLTKTYVEPPSMGERKG